MIDKIGNDFLKLSEAPGFAATNRGAVGEGLPFSEVLKKSVMKVNDAQTEADELAMRLALGEVDDVSEVAIAVEKAELALRMMVQIRDKLVDAYQQIARMSV